MSKITEEARLPEMTHPQDFVRRLTELHRDVARQVNGLTEGRIGVDHTAHTAAPTGGTWAQGDWVANSAPEELGVAGAKYVIKGWHCVAGGTPGTWVEKRELTGN